MPLGGSASGGRFVPHRANFGLGGTSAAWRPPCWSGGETRKILIRMFSTHFKTRFVRKGQLRTGTSAFFCSARNGGNVPLASAPSICLPSVMREGSLCPNITPLLAAPSLRYPPLTSACPWDFKEARDAAVATDYRRKKLLY